MEKHFLHTTMIQAIKRRRLGTAISALFALVGGGALFWQLNSADRSGPGGPNSNSTLPAIVAQEGAVAQTGPSSEAILRSSESAPPQEPTEAPSVPKVNLDEADRQLIREVAGFADATSTEIGQGIIALGGSHELRNLIGPLDQEVQASFQARSDVIETIRKERLTSGRFESIDIGSFDIPEEYRDGTRRLPDSWFKEHRQPPDPKPQFDGQSIAVTAGGGIKKVVTINPGEDARYDATNAKYQQSLDLRKAAIRSRLGLPPR